MHYVWRLLRRQPWHHEGDDMKTLFMMLGGIVVIATIYTVAVSYILIQGLPH